MLLPCIYIKPDDNIKKLFNGKIDLILRKLLKTFGQGSELKMRVGKLIGSKSWKSTWLILLQNRNSWLAKSTRKKVKNPQLTII